MQIIFYIGSFLMLNFMTSILFLISFIGFLMLVRQYFLYRKRPIQSFTDLLNVRGGRMVHQFIIVSCLLSVGLSLFLCGTWSRLFNLSNQILYMMWGVIVVAWGLKYLKIRSIFNKRYHEQSGDNA